VIEVVSEAVLAAGHRDDDPLPETRREVVLGQASVEGCLRRPRATRALEQPLGPRGVEVPCVVEMSVIPAS
jgi:hypothetical protein